MHELKIGLKELYGDRLVKLILFGSHARGEANLDSDIDLLAVLKSPVSQVQEISYYSMYYAAQALLLSQNIDWLIKDWFAYLAYIS